MRVCSKAWLEFAMLACRPAGGRVSDSFDRRVLTTYLEEYLGDFLFDTFQPFHFYTGRDGSSIDVPPAAPREVYIKAIEALPLVQSPEVRADGSAGSKHCSRLPAVRCVLQCWVCRVMQDR
jgi:hypothetical protein